MSTQFGLVVQIKWRVEIEYVSVLFMLVKPFVKFALRRFLLRWQPTERSDKGVGRCSAGDRDVHGFTHLRFIYRVQAQRNVTRLEYKPNIESN